MQDLLRAGSREEAVRVDAGFGCRARRQTHRPRADVFKSAYNDYEAVPHAVVGPLVLVLALVGAQTTVQILSDV